MQAQVIAARLIHAGCHLSGLCTLPRHEASSMACPVALLCLPVVRRAGKLPARLMQPEAWDSKQGKAAALKKALQRGAPRHEARSSVAEWRSVARAWRLLKRLR